MANLVTGIENLLKNPPHSLNRRRLGLLCNPASINRLFCHSKHLIHQHFPGQLRVLFSPQHGFFAEKQDNMIESDDLIDPELNIPIFSLYGQTRIPTDQMLEQIDILLIDLQDVGTRVYTFTSTISYCLEIAAKMDKQVVVLDRPNPINGIQIEGNCLASQFTSFVGRYPIPMRHGLTIGEYALFINQTYNIGCVLKVIPMNGWNRKMYFQHTRLPWVPPSPNLPTAASTMVYPGQVIWEGTNISEGRGTTLPFEVFGAPFINTDKILSFLNKQNPPGAVLRPVVFEPTYHKWQGQICHGFHIHIINPYDFNPYLTSLKLLQAVIYHHEKHFEWKSPPYEYEWKKCPFDLIVGNDKIRKQLMEYENIESTCQEWNDELSDFISASSTYYLYE